MDEKVYVVVSSETQKYYATFKTRQSAEWAIAITYEKAPERKTELEVIEALVLTQPDHL